MDKKNEQIAIHLSTDKKAQLMQKRFHAQKAVGTAKTQWG
jgi:hypothetical protein